MAYDAENFVGPNGVNVAEILRVADLVEKSATFSMADIHHNCGTPACIYGHLVEMHQHKIDREVSGFAPSKAWERGCEILGIAHDLGCELFEPRQCAVAHWMAEPRTSSFITNAHAAACLRNLAATGVVDWLGTKPSPNTPA
jgi:hypothetical protein